MVFPARKPSFLAAKTNSNYTKKNIFNLLFLVLLSNGLLAQTNDNFQNKGNIHYWKNRPPFEGYWQQDVHYKIDANINEKTNVIEAKEKLLYTNNSPHILHEVYFHLYQNAFTKGSYLEELHKVNNQPVKRMGKYQSQGLGTIVENITVNGVKVKASIDNTIMKIILPEPLKPNQTITFEMNFATFFDRGDFRRRMALSYVNGFPHYNGVHWYPRISVYDAKKGWDTDQHLNKELYGNFGEFEVNLTFPDNYIVEATGELTNESEVLPTELRQKIDIKNFANKPYGEKPSTIIPYDSTKRKTWTYRALNVHDFAFTADPSYRLGETSWNGVRCIAIVKESSCSKWQTAPDYVSKIIKTFSEDFGMFDYPKMVVADADDGMEYPMITLCSGTEPDFHGLFTHEIGHNWFYGMIGSNETYRAALDEGFTQFITSWGLEKIDGPVMIGTPSKNKYTRKFKEELSTRDRNVYIRYLRDAIRADDKMLNTHSNDFHNALGHENGYSNVYHKTATMLYNLQYLLGDDLFIKSMQHYVAKWKFAHPYFEDFRQSIIEYTQQDLNWFFDQWLETTKSTDYGITKIKKGLSPNDYKIEFKRYGQMQMPIDFSITAKNGTVTNYTIPNTYFVKKTTSKVLKQWYGWDLLYPTYTAKVNIPSGIKVVQIDPSLRLADIDMMDNYKRPNQKLAQESLKLKLENYVANTSPWQKYNATMRPDIWWNAVDGLKLGVNFNGSYFDFLRKLYATVWFNSRILSQEKYRPFEGQSWYENVSPIDYTVRYETPLKKYSTQLGWGLESRLIEGFAKHSLYGTYQLTTKQKFKLEATTLYRKSGITNAYLFNPNEWTSYSSGDGINTVKNSFLQLSYQTQHQTSKNRTDLMMNLRAPLNYQYAYLQGELKQLTQIKKFELKTRLFARYGLGNNVPTESAVYMQGANPEEMMENKYSRSQGVFPLNSGQYATDNFANFHTGGGLNLRGYNGYYAVDANEAGQVFINYKSRSGAAINVELDFDRYFSKIRPKILRNFLHVDAYLFADAGMVERGNFDGVTITKLNPTTKWSKPRMDAGIGTAITIKRFGPLETIKPFTIRVDFPLFLSNPPYAQDKFLDFRYVVGISRAF